MGGLRLSPRYVRFHAPCGKKGHKLLKNRNMFTLLFLKRLFSCLETAYS